MGKEKCQCNHQGDRGRVDVCIPADNASISSNNSVMKECFPVSINFSLKK